MLSALTGNKQLNVNLRYKDYFIDFLACLIPGFLFLVLSVTIIFSTIYLFFKFIPYTGSLNLFLSFENLKNLKNVVYFPFWIHVSIFIMSFMFGFFLYRQDPKKPDHVSYLKNRETVKGYNEWVIKNTEGLHPKEVQFPYCNLSNYLESRGFKIDKDVVNWDCNNENSGDIQESNQKNRSKAFVNKLKMRISFFYPEALSSIIKNEAHIRFASSMWYGFHVLIKMLYGSILLLIIYEYLILIKFKCNVVWFILVSLVNILIISHAIYRILKKNGDSEIYEKDHKQNEIFIDKEAIKITDIYRKYDISPFISSISLVVIIYIGLIFKLFGNHDYAYLLLMNVCLISILSFFIFYAKQKIEISFHYQRVREITYVIEMANLSRVLKDEDVNKLLNEKIAQPLHSRAELNSEPWDSHNRDEIG